MINRSCSFTGHRSIPSEDSHAVREGLIYEITRLIGEGYEIFYAGGALGFDTEAEEAVLSLREKFPHIKLILALPCPEQADRWSEKDKAVYFEIADRADGKVYLSDRYTRDCMFKRNRYMVDNSSVCICYLTKNSGGTAYTAEYARKKGLRILNIASGCPSARDRLGGNFPT